MPLVLAYKFERNRQEGLSWVFSEFGEEAGREAPEILEEEGRKEARTGRDLLWGLEGMDTSRGRVPAVPGHCVGTTATEISPLHSLQTFRNVCLLEPELLPCE